MEQTAKEQAPVGTLRLWAENSRLDELTAFLECHLAAARCPAKAQTQILLAAEEVFVNIAAYAYPPGGGEVEVALFLDGPALTLRFADGGRPFDPLSRPEPDTGLAAHHRDIGGLGILLVKKTMDDVAYEYTGGKNRLTLCKNIAPGGAGGAGATAE